MKFSLAKGQAPVLCPACPQDSDSEGVATVGGEGGPRDSYGHRGPFLEAFACELGHSLADLTPSQEGAILESAVDYIADAIENLRSAANDQAYDTWADR